MTVGGVNVDDGQQNEVVDELRSLQIEVQQLREDWQNMLVGRQCSKCGHHVVMHPDICAEERDERVAALEKNLTAAREAVEFLGRMVETGQAHTEASRAVLRRGLNGPPSEEPAT